MASSRWAPYTTEQIVTIYDYLHKLGGPKGIIRQSELFPLQRKRTGTLFTSVSREDISSRRLHRGFVPAKMDFELVKDIGLKETGILVSCSDYHISIR